MAQSSQQRSTRRRWRPGRILLFLFVAGALFVVLYAWHLATPQVDYMLERRGTLMGQDVVTSETDAIVSEQVGLWSSTGLSVELRVLRPASSEPLPVLIMLGGHDTGRDAVDLVGEPDGVAFVALDYPYTANQHPDGFWESIGIVDDIQRAFLDSPPALSLTLDWLLEQPWVDPAKVNLIGLSLGVPFTAAAGALDERFSRVWLLHGGGDNVSWVSHVGRKRIKSETLRRIAARGALLLVYGNTFDTPRWILDTAPRPVVLVMARDDDYVPKEAQQPLIDVAGNDHVELIWTEGMHIGPKRTFELQQLLGIVLSKVR